MLILVTYDVNTQTEAGRKRLRCVAKKCESRGQRVQNSVFECSLDSAELVSFKHELCDIIDIDTDSLRFYNLGSGKNKVEHIGAKPTYDPNGLLLV